MRVFIIALSMLLYAAIPADAQVSIGIQTHGVSIGFNVSSYPRLVAIPGYPVYYDPRADSNYFFYDGLYWVYQDDNWYSSAWYDGPWDLVGPEDVPLFVLRVPVRYYRHRPSYFSGWSLSLAPRWGEHWGHDWEQRRSGWDRWDRHSVPRAAPLPTYQRQYSGSRYPRAPEQQYSIQSKSYRYQPREAVTQQYFQQHAVPNATRAETSQQTQTQQQTRARDQSQAQQRKEQAQAQQQTRAKDQAPAQQQTQAREQAQAQAHTRAKDQAQAQQRTQAREQAQAQQQTRAKDQAQAQQQTQAREQAQAQQQTRAKDQAQAQQQTQAREQAQAQQQTRAKDQAQAQPQQSRGKDQVQQSGQQQGSAPKRPSNQQQQQQKKDKEDKNDKNDKKDGGGPDGH